MGHTRRELPPGWLFCDPWWCCQWPGGRLCATEVHGLAEAIRAAGSRWYDVLRGRAGARAGAHRPADLLVYDVYGRHDPARVGRGEYRWYAEMAHGPVAARPVLAGGHEARIPGCRFVDADEEHAAGAPQSRLALCAVRDLENRIVEKDDCRADADTQFGPGVRGHE